MRRSTRRLLVLLASVPAVLFLLAMLYMLGMEHLEGAPRTFGQSVEFVSETLTTTGYGADARWQSAAMQVFVVVIQFAGLALTILVFPVFVVPFIEERFEARLSQQLPDLRGAVVIYGWGPAVSPLAERLDHLRVPVVVVEEDLTTARRLHDRGRTVIHAGLEDESLDFTRLAGARGLVAAGSDPANAVITLAARQGGFTGPIAAMVTTPARRGAMTRAGASAVFTPGHILAAAIAARASDKISPRVSGAATLGEHVRIAEMRIDAGSQLAGKTLAESNLRKRTGATVVGWWRDGELHPPPGPQERLEKGTILVVAGTDAGIKRLGELATPVARKGPIFVIGADEVADKASEFLELAGEDVRRVSPRPYGVPEDDCHAIGDPLDPTILEKSGVREARAVILALDGDAETLFAAAVVRDLSPEASIVASARRAENVGRIRRAGADFALSVGQVAGQLLAFQLLGEEMVALEAEIRVVRTGAGELAGRHLADARVGQLTGCSVVAIERGSEVIADFGPDFEVRQGDALYVTGSSDHIDRFYEAFPGAHATS